MRSRRRLGRPRAWIAAIAASAAIAGSAHATEPEDVATDLEPAIAAAERMPRLHSLLVSQRRELILEHYFNGTSADDIANVKSVSKSIVSALVGIAIEQGHLDGVDQPIGAFFDGLLAQADDAPKRAITIGDLLTMQSGLETTSNRNYGSWVQSPDWVEDALARPLEHPPGSIMVYSTGNTHLLSAILTQATGHTTLEYARRVLAAPLGFHLASWPQGPKGIYFGGNDMELTPRQMLAFGELYLDGGNANGRQIVPREWVEASLRPHAESTREQERFYGYGWWIRDSAGLRTPYAWGYGGQFIMLVPSLDLVIVTTSDSRPDPERRSYGHRRRLQRLIEHRIIAPLARAQSAPLTARSSRSPGERRSGGRLVERDNHGRERIPGARAFYGILPDIE